MTAFRIGEEEFPIPTGFTFADGPLVYEASGLEFGEFAERLDSMGDDSADIRALAGLVAVAIARAHPGWSRKQVVKFLGDVDLEAFQVEGDDVGPPAEAPTESLGDGSSGASITSPEDSPGVPV